MKISGTTDERGNKGREGRKWSVYPTGQREKRQGNGREDCESRR